MTMIEGTMRSMARAGLAVLLASSLHAPILRPALAATVERVAGFEILDNERPSDPRPCQMVRDFAGDSPSKPEKELFFSQEEGGRIFVSLTNRKWNWPPNKTPKVRFQIDDRAYASVWPWIIMKDTLAGTFDGAVVSRLEAGKRIVVGLPDGPVDFDLTGFQPAFAALQRCNRTLRPDQHQANPSAPAATSEQERETGRSRDLVTTPTDLAAPSTAGEASPAVEGDGTSPSAPDRERKSDDPATIDELKGMAFLAGAIMLNAIERCDVATTGRQRTAVSEKVAALRAQLPDLDSAFQETASKEPCPGAADAEVPDALRSYVAKPAEDYALDLLFKKGRAALTSYRQIVAQARPAANRATKTEQPRSAAYLYGLVLRDVIGACDIRTTAKQRTSFEAKMASLQPEMAALEPALIEKKGPFTACPAADRIADMQAALPLFIEKSPEDFAAEMDRRAKAR